MAFAVSGAPAEYSAGSSLLVRPAVHRPWSKPQGLSHCQCVLPMAASITVGLGKRWLHCTARLILLLLDHLRLSQAEGMSTTGGPWTWSEAKAEASMYSLHSQHGLLGGTL